MLIKEFEKIHRENKASLILISHQERIIRMADRIMIIRDGRVEEIGTKERSILISWQKNLKSSVLLCRNRRIRT